MLKLIATRVENQKYSLKLIDNEEPVSLVLDMAKVVKDLKDLDMDVLRLKKLVNEAQPAAIAKDKDNSALRDLVAKIYTHLKSNHVMTSEELQAIDTTNLPEL
jgi:hypothetical protein